MMKCLFKPTGAALGGERSWAIQRQKDNCWGLKTPSPSSAPPKLDPGDVQWDLLCFCCKAPALLNTHSESLGKLCNHASASWQRTAVWLQFRSAPWERTGFCGNQARAGGWGVEESGVVGGSPEGNLKEAVPQHLYLVCVSPLRNRRGSGAGTTTLCKLLAKWTSQAEMSGGRNIQTIDMLYYMHVKVLNSVRKKKIHTMMTLYGRALQN